MQQFKVGDHVIVDGDYGNHNLAAGFDGKVAGVGGRPLVEAYSPVHDRLSWQFVHASALIKVDDLVTFPEFKVGDRALVVGNTSYTDGGCGHAIAVGTDVEIVAAARMVGDRVLCEARGAHKINGRRIEQYVAPCDLEAEPTYPRRSWWVDYAPADYKAERTIDYTLTPAATVALDDNLVRRYLALHGATELLGTSRDVDELTAVADWLLGDAA